jgi:hypothetical protein
MEPQRAQRNTLCPQKISERQRGLGDRLVGRGRSYYRTERCQEMPRMKAKNALIYRG